MRSKKARRSVVQWCTPSWPRFGKQIQRSGTRAVTNVCKEQITLESSKLDNFLNTFAKEMKIIPKWCFEVPKSICEKKKCGPSTNIREFGFDILWIHHHLTNHHLELAYIQKGVLGAQNKGYLTFTVTNVCIGYMLNDAFDLSKWVRKAYTFNVATKKAKIC